MFFGEFKSFSVCFFLGGCDLGFYKLERRTTRIWSVDLKVLL